MGHACTPDDLPSPRPNGEHPIIAVIAVIAIIAAILLITWARLEVHGTEDIEAALVEVPAGSDAPLPRTAAELVHEDREVDAAVTSSRFATGFSP